MKIKIVAISAIALILTFTNCEKVKDVINEYTKFDIPYSTEVTIPNTAGINVPYDVTTPNIPSLLNDRLSENNTNEELIENITLKSMTLTVVDPAGEDFSFLKSIEINMITDNHTEKLAWKDVVTDGSATSISLETTDTDVRDLLKMENFKLNLKLTNKEGLTDNHKIDIAFVFEIDAQLLD